MKAETAPPAGFCFVAEIRGKTIIKKFPIGKRADVHSAL